MGLRCEAACNRMHMCVNLCLSNELKLYLSDLMQTKRQVQRRRPAHPQLLLQCSMPHTEMPLLFECAAQAGLPKPGSEHVGKYTSVHLSHSAWMGCNGQAAQEIKMRESITNTMKRGSRQIMM